MLKGDTPAKDRINRESFERLCGMWCTLVEISDFFGVSEDTLEDWCKDTYDMTFSEIWKKRSSQGRISLRRYQLEQAKKNPTMAIWLGKQYLDQTDKIEERHEVNNGVLGDLIGALNNAKEDK